jgi:hypothetical protein
VAAEAGPVDARPAVTPAGEEPAGVAAANRASAALPAEGVAAANRPPVATPAQGAVEVWPSREATQAQAVVVEAVVVAAEVNRREAVGPAPTGRHSSGVDHSSASTGHSGTLPCLRRGSSSRLVANIRRPATSFWRVSAGSITSSM